MPKKSLRKKGVSLSFETIVVAAIALTVLVVIILIFTGTLQGLVKDLINLNSCESRKGTCYDSSQDGKNCFISGCQDQSKKWCCTSE